MISSKLFIVLTEIAFHTFSTVIVLTGIAFHTFSTVIVLTGIAFLILLQ
jgi:hypothetical protein